MKKGAGWAFTKIRSDVFGGTKVRKMMCSFAFNPSLLYIQTHSTSLHHKARLCHSTNQCNQTPEASQCRQHNPLRKGKTQISNFQTRRLALHTSNDDIGRVFRYDFVVVEHFEFCIPSVQSWKKGGKEYPSHTFRCILPHMTKQRLGTTGMLIQPIRHI